MTLKHTTNNFIIVTFILSLFFSPVVTAEEVDAVLTWSKRVELSSPASGVVQEVFAQQGSIVAKGEVLVQLDPRVFKAELKHAKAQVVSTSEQYQEAKRELARQADMYDRSMLSEHDLQTAKNNLTFARSQLRQAESSLAKAEVTLEYSAVRAPFNALVINTSAVKGQVVASSLVPPVLVVIAEAHRMLARLNLGSDKINNVEANQGVKVSVAGKIYQGKIVAIALEPGKDNTYAVEVIFDSEKDILRSGQKAKVIL